MKKANRILIGILAVAAILLPFAGLVAGALLVPSQYDKTFFGELDAKTKRLYSLEENKLVVVGGSSVAFGLDSALLEKYTGMPVVNFGLYADLGTKLMLDLSEDAIKAGDIVVLAPELDAQTLSMYFSGFSSWKAFDDYPSLFLPHVKKSNYSSLWGNLWAFNTERCGFLMNGKPDPEGVYNSRNFNQYGDILYLDGNGADLRTENEMNGAYLSSTPIDPDISILDPEFKDYLNGYIERLTERGAKVCFAFCPMNRMAIVGSDGKCIENDPLPTEKIAAFEAALAEAIDCPILGSYADSVYDASYFFDTNFHLTTEGTLFHTANLIRNLFAERGETAPEITELAGHSLSRTEIKYADLTVGDFLYRTVTTSIYRAGSEEPVSQTVEGAVAGVTPEGLVKETLLVPVSVSIPGGGLCQVTKIAERAFADCRTTTTVVVADSARMKELGSDAFIGSSVKELYLYCPVAGFAPGQFMNGVASGFTIYVAEEHYTDYTTDYGWESIPVTATSKLYADFSSGLADVGDFLTRQNGDGSVTITGLSVVGLRGPFVIIPREIDGKRVTRVAAGAFTGAELVERVVIAPDASFTFEDGAFAGSSVKKINPYCPPSAVTVSTGFLSGISGAFPLAIHQDIIDTYKANSVWSAFASRMISSSDAYEQWAPSEDAE